MSKGKKTVAAKTTINTQNVEETKVVESTPAENVTQETKVEDTPVVEEVNENEVKEEVNTSVTTDEPLVVTPDSVETVEETTPTSDEPHIPTLDEVKDKSEVVTEQRPVTEGVSGKKEISGSNSNVQIELSKKYKVKFAQSYFMKICASTREFSLFSIIETFNMNRSAYVGLLSLDDLEHIKEFLNNNVVTYKYEVLTPVFKKQFLEKLEFNTQYAITHR